MSKVFKRGKAGIYYAPFRDHLDIKRIMATGFKDKINAENFLRELESFIQQKKTGKELCGHIEWLERLTDKQRKTLKSYGLLNERQATIGTNIVEHINEYGKHIEANGSTDRHRITTINRINRVRKEFNAKKLSDITAPKFEKWKIEQRKKGMSPNTRNCYLIAISSLLNWAIDNDFMDKNPLRKIKKENIDIDRRLVRRAGSNEEMRALILYLRTTETTLHGLTSTERALMYLIDLETGLRWNEIRKLQRRDVILDDKPRIIVRAENAKNKKEAEQPLRSKLASTIKDYFKGSLTMPNVEVFSRCRKMKGALMLRTDCENARAEAMKSNPELENTDFLKYIDDRGRYLDFHALRHTFITNLEVNGVPHAIAKKLARHSTKGMDITLDVYTHLEYENLRNALEALPDLDIQPEMLSATGTDDKVCVSFCVRNDTQSDILRQEKATLKDTENLMLENQKAVNPLFNKDTVISERNKTSERSKKDVHHHYSEQEAKNPNISIINNTTEKTLYANLYIKDDLDRENISQIIENWNSLPSEIQGAITALIKSNISNSEPITLDHASREGGYID